MIDKQKLQETIYKYEDLIKNKELYQKGHFTEVVFRELGIEEDETNEVKENYCKKESHHFELVLQPSQLKKKFLHILQILPFQAKLHYYCYDLQQALKDKHLSFHQQQYEISISFDEEYKYITFPDYSLLEYIADLKYNNPLFEELEFDRLEEIQINLLKKENMNFEEYSYETKGKDIKINNKIVELKTTKNIQKINTSFALNFKHASKKTADYFILSYIFEDEQNMLNIIMKNYNYDAEDIEIMIPKSFYDVANDSSLTDSEKIEKLKDISIQHKGVKLKFCTTSEVKEFFDNL
ncbi:MAG: hypothetical protein QXL51_07805 [Candidatus Aenigmatarchaeota archaeon]